MASIFAFEGFVPVVHESAFVHPNATVVGNVVVGRDVYVGPGAVIRGDWGGIEIADGCNVQEGCIVHMFPGIVVRLEANAHIGHGAVVHGAHIGRNVLIGMNAVVMDEADIGDESIVGALCFVPGEMKIPPRSLVVGNPAKIVRQVTDEMLAWKTAGTELYQTLPARLRESLEPCEPLRVVPAGRQVQSEAYKTLKATRR